MLGMEPSKLAASEVSALPTVLLLGKNNFSYCYFYDTELSLYQTITFMGVDFVGRGAHLVLF